MFFLFCSLSRSEGVLTASQPSQRLLQMGLKYPKQEPTHELPRGKSPFKKEKLREKKRFYPHVLINHLSLSSFLSALFRCWSIWAPRTIEGFTRRGSELSWEDDLWPSTVSWAWRTSRSTVACRGSSLWRWRHSRLDFICSKARRIKTRTRDDSTNTSQKDPSPREKKRERRT